MALLNTNLENCEDKIPKQEKCNKTIFIWDVSAEEDIDIFYSDLDETGMLYEKKMFLLMMRSTTKIFFIAESARDDLAIVVVDPTATAVLPCPVATNLLCLQKFSHHFGLAKKVLSMNRELKD